MANRFESRRGGFADMAAARRKRPKSFLDDVERVIDWKPIERFLNKKLRRHKDAVGNPAYPALGMFKILLLQRDNVPYFSLLSGGGGLRLVK